MDASATHVSTDVPIEELESDEDEENLFIHVPSRSPALEEADIFAIIPTLCYGSNGYVDMLELCGGEGGITKLAFRRGLTSGGNLDKKTNVDLGKPTIQRIIIHYLHNCHVETVILQPNCRTTGLPSYFNAQVNYETWLLHHNEDLPHIKFCGRIAILQDDLKRHYLREQPRGTWVDEIEPWDKLILRPNTVKTHFDQCAAGLTLSLIHI